MPLSRRERWVRAKQVGSLMRMHRQEFVTDNGRQGLTLPGLLRHMADAMPMDDGDHGSSILPADHSTLSRLERGETLYTRERLEVIGRALNLSRVEVDGLIVLAGFETDSQPGVNRAASQAVAPGRREKPAKPARADGDQPANVVEDMVADPNLGTGSEFGYDRAGSFLSETCRFFMFRFLLPGLGVAGAGYLLWSLGLTANWMLMLYVGVVMGLVVFQGLFRMNRATDLRDLLFVSVFFVMSTPLLGVPVLGVDNYGFFMLVGGSGSAITMVLALATNFVMALIASVAFDWLWRWQYSRRGAGKAYQRALWVVIPPLSFVYVCSLTLSNVGGWTRDLPILMVVAGVMSMVVVLRDRSVTLEEWDRRFLLFFAMTTIIVLAIFGAASTMAGYLQPATSFLNGHVLIHSWEIDHTLLGYPEAELAERLRVSYAWNMIASICYLVIVMGGTLMVTIYRAGNGDAANPTADIGELPAAESAPPGTFGERVKSLLGPGRLSGSPIYQKRA